MHLMSDVGGIVELFYLVPSTVALTGNVMCGIELRVVMIFDDSE